MDGNKEYSVTIRAKDRVAALLPVPEHRLPSSNLDLLLPALDFGVFFCYKKPSTPSEQSSTFAAMASSLKTALAQVLVAYYPLAGEVVATADGEPELLCNNRGVDFVEAYADLELAKLNLYNPDESVEKLLVPKKKDGVLCVQVTELKCGGLVLACTVDHRIADAYSANMFLVAWSETAAGEPLSHLPSFRRSLLSPRHPLNVDPFYDHLYVPLSSIPPPKEDDCHLDVAVNRIYYICAKDLQWLQASTYGHTKIEAFTAYLWRAIARATGPPKATPCHMGIVVNGRSRLGGHAGSTMGSYFGNVLSITHGTLSVEELHKMGVEEVADEVRRWLGPATTEEHFRGLVDWVEAHRPEPAVTRIYSGGGVGCVVSSGRGFPVGEVEFGWGKAVLGSYHFPWGGSAGYVMPMPSAKGNGDWLVYAHLGKGVVEVLEAAEPPLFRPLTPEYYLT